MELRDSNSYLHTINNNRTNNIHNLLSYWNAFRQNSYCINKCAKQGIVQIRHLLMKAFPHNNSTNHSCNNYINSNNRQQIEKYCLYRSMIEWLTTTTILINWAQTRRVVFATLFNSRLFCPFFCAGHQFCMFNTAEVRFCMLSYVE